MLRRKNSTKKTLTSTAGGEKKNLHFPLSLSRSSTPTAAKNVMSLLKALLSCVISLALFRFVLATSSAQAPAPAAPAVAAAATPSLLTLLFAPRPRSPLSALYVTNRSLPSQPLPSNGCIQKSLSLSSACSFAFDAMQQAVDSGAQARSLSTALAVTQASRRVGPAATQACMDNANAFFGGGCVCEPAVILGITAIGDIVPPVAKQQLFEVAKRCPSAPVPPRGVEGEGEGDNNNNKGTLAEALSLLATFLKTPPPPPSASAPAALPAAADKAAEVSKNAGGGAPPLKG